MQIEALQAGGSSRFQKHPVRQLQSHKPVNFRRVIAVALEMTVYDGFEHVCRDVGPREGTLVKEHFADVRR